MCVTSPTSCSTSSTPPRRRKRPGMCRARWSCWPGSASRSWCCSTSSARRATPRVTMPTCSAGAPTSRPSRRCARCFRSMPLRAAGCRSTRCCRRSSSCWRGEQRALMARLRAAWHADRLGALRRRDAARSRTALARIASGARAGGRRAAACANACASSAPRSGSATPTTARPPPPSRHSPPGSTPKCAPAPPQLIALHGLAGEAQGEILSLLARHYEMRLRVGEGPAALLGGMMTGALAGLKADIATRRPDARRRPDRRRPARCARRGGSRALLQPRARHRAVVARHGTPQALDQAVEAALLRYLAVAHFGRGRGEWTHDQPPPAWSDAAGAARRAGAHLAHARDDAARASGASAATGRA